MVGLLPTGTFYSHQRVAERPSLGDQPPPPLALKSSFTMLDSGGMSETDDKPPTLASLRARRGKLRPRKKPSSPPAGPDSLNQSGLFSDMSEIAPIIDNQPAEHSTVREDSPFRSQKSQRKPT